MSTARLDMIATPLANQTLAPLGSDIVIAEWAIEGTPVDTQPMLMAPPHTHHHDDEAWYVLEGTLGVRIDDQSFEVTAGGAIVAPRGTVHTFWNPHPTPVRYLIMMTQRIKALIDAIHSLEQRDSETMKRLFAQYGAELI